MKTGRWFHGKEVKKHNPAREIERNLLTAPTIAKPKQSSPKIIKTGFPASTVTKAQLEAAQQLEDRELAQLKAQGESGRRNSTGTYSTGGESKKSSLHEQILGSSKLGSSDTDSEVC